MCYSPFHDRILLVNIMRVERWIVFRHLIHFAHRLCLHLPNLLRLMWVVLILHDGVVAAEVVGMDAVEVGKLARLRLIWSSSQYAGYETSFIAGGCINSNSFLKLMGGLCRLDRFFWSCAPDGAYLLFFAVQGEPRGVFNSDGRDLRAVLVGWYLDLLRPISYGHITILSFSQVLFLLTFGAFYINHGLFRPLL